MAENNKIPDINLRPPHEHSGMYMSSCTIYMYKYVYMHVDKYTFAYISLGIFEVYIIL